MADRPVGWPAVDTSLGMRVGREIRAHREARGLSLTAAAQRAGVSKTSLATIEAGSGNPSLDTLARIAGALDVPVAALLAGEQPVLSQLVRRGDGEWMTFESGIDGRILHVDGRDRRSELLELRLPARQRYVSEPHAPGTEELVICLEGALAVGPEGAEQRLEPGDALRFAGDVRHSYRAEAHCRALCWFSYPAVHSR
jgi:transcriptional regulator with XRE-family HTH domain